MARECPAPYAPSITSSPITYSAAAVFNRWMNGSLAAGSPWGINSFETWLPTMLQSSPCRQAAMTISSTPPARNSSARALIMASSPSEPGDAGATKTARRCRCSFVRRPPVSRPTAPRAIQWRSFVVSASIKLYKADCKNCFRSVGGLQIPTTSKRTFQYSRLRRKAQTKGLFRSVLPSAAASQREIRELDGFCPS